MHTDSDTLARSFGIHPDDLQHIPGDQIENQEQLLEIFFSIASAHQLICLLAAWNDSGASVSGLLRTDAYDIFRFGRIHTDIFRCSAVAFEDSTGSAVILDEEEISAVSPVSFSHDTMIFEFETRYPLLPQAELIRPQNRRSCICISGLRIPTPSCRRMPCTMPDCSCGSG